ncbi:hypothetical protein EOS_12345 [Caballeronia mineralivorans PML1(12)]|uniref:Uncharacterized protein n=2 Tax=Caballeronia mineralivorans TaxID=2010198 RepID=A0A0J1CZF4_9BURK|nr:hypothetical protein EOS_12345 [Caballeronia mineralivorans PML1(12)]
MNNDVLARAQANNELDKFLTGESPYFFEARIDNDEPQNVSAAFDLLVLPYWKRTGDLNFPARLFGSLADLLQSYPDKNRAIYVAHDWIWYYLYCLVGKRTQPNGVYGDIFEADLNALAAVLKAELESNKQSLIGDTRWAGATWNSTNGMWGPLLYVSEAVVKRGGPNFVPDNA